MRARAVAAGDGVEDELVAAVLPCSSTVSLKLGLSQAALFAPTVLLSCGWHWIGRRGPALRRPGAVRYELDFHVLMVMPAAPDHGRFRSRWDCRKRGDFEIPSGVGVGGHMRPQ